MDKLIIRGAREHNLKNIDLDLPRDKLIVVSGLSGSGKSSLAFDTIFAEGQRRYVESLSSYARQFLGRMDKPDLDYIEGLSPAISIEQKTTHRNPRSTVGTVTEIYDYYRLLFARIGLPHCPKCGREIREQSVDQIVDSLFALGDGVKVQILSPVIRGKKGEHTKIIEDARKAGFARARIDGVIAPLDDTIKLDKQKKHTIEIVVDRLVISKEGRSRLAESVEAALETSEGLMLALVDVAGGQGTAVAGYRLPVAGNNGGTNEKNIQRVGSVAGGNDSNRDDLQGDAAISEGGNVRSFESNAESGSVDSGEHSGGKRKKNAERLRALPDNIGQFKVGVGDAHSNRGKSGLHSSGDIQQIANPTEHDGQTDRGSLEVPEEQLRADSESAMKSNADNSVAPDISDKKPTTDNRQPTTELFFSQKNSCPDCGISIPELQPRMFSFNNPFGACPECGGLGAKLEFDADLVIPNRSLSFNEGGCVPYNPESPWYRSKFEALSRHFKFSLDTPFKDLPRRVLDAILYGTEDELTFKYENTAGTNSATYRAPYPGVLEELKRRYLETQSQGVKDWLEKFMSQTNCVVCGGKRLRPESLAVTVGSKNIYQISSLSVEDTLAFFEKLKFSPNEQKIAAQILKEITARLGFLKNVGLDYLSLERKAGTLSGGEAQRIRLATQIGSQLVGVLYILDEPSIGLHQRDNQRLIDTLLFLRDLGNTLIVVEHDEQTLRTADYIVDLGPGAGVHGGSVVAEGTPQEVARVKESLTGQYLAGTLKMEIPKERRTGNGRHITLKGVSEHNLKNIDASFPLGVFTCITGVSGSGKSTLLSDVLFPALSNIVTGSNHAEGAYKKITGAEHIDKVIDIDQSPIGRTPRSNPATYVGVFTAIRDLFASLPEAKARGYKSGRFSFNVRGGRCENCEGGGEIKIEMNFLPDVYITCDVCGGKRFNRETLEIHYKGKNIADVLNMTIEEACEFFEYIPHIAHKMETLLSVGLGYIKLGQSALTLSGGEAQRVKLALELSRRSTGKTLYILDEPTTGLHFADVKQLMEVIQRLVNQGNTVIMIEHNLDVLAQADHLIDLGPEGGDKGGNVVFVGAPEEIVYCKESHTGKYLKEVLERG